MSFDVVSNAVVVAEAGSVHGDELLGLEEELA
jgi:hypothetical protein